MRGSPIAHRTEANDRSPDAKLVADRLRSFAAEFDRRFEECLTPTGPVPGRLQSAVRYSALAPGKRVRPYLVVESCKLVSGIGDEVWAAAAAVECVHAFSLIHDDLPAMDDDDLRRGRPSCHRQFDEATAILAGDALLSLAFELLVCKVSDSALAGRLIQVLAQATGWAGVIGGQMADLVGESQPPSVERTQSIHERKTGALIRAACEIGGLVGRAPAQAMTSLIRFGQMVGRAFQIADDLLDVSAKSAESGKPAGKDAARRKQTYPRCVGTEQARRAAEDAAQEAIAAIEPFGAPANDLRALARFIVARDH